MLHVTSEKLTTNTIYTYATIDNPSISFSPETSEMTDGASVDTVTWHTKFLLQGLISDSENSSSNLHFTSHHEEYGFCETVCDPSPESLTLELFSLKFFRAAKVVGRRLTNVYLSSPILLMLAPFIVGIFAGWVACRIWDRGLNSSHNQRSHKHKVQKQVQSKKTIQLISVRNEFKNFIHCCYNLFWKHFFHTLTCVVSLCLQIIQSLETYISRISGPRNFDENTRADEARRQLRSKAETERESGVELSHVPRHIAVIMDGNRRYGKAKYGSISKVRYYPDMYTLCVISHPWHVFQNWALNPKNCKI